MPTVIVNDVPLYFEDAGEGPAVLLLHGWGTSARVWYPQQAELVADHRVVVVDWRGCGRSGRPATGNTFDQVVADLAGLVETLGLDRPVVAGSSIGGVFATELALARPDLVGGVVPVDSPGYWPGQDMDVPAITRGMSEDRAGFVASWVPNWYAGDRPELVAWTIRQLLDAGPFVDAHLAEAAVYDPRPRLPGLQVPIHYLHGELDAEIPVAVAATCAALTPGAGLTVLDGVGHMSHQEAPGRFTAALREAVASCRS